MATTAVPAPTQLTTHSPRTSTSRSSVPASAASARRSGCSQEGFDGLRPARAGRRPRRHLAGQQLSRLCLRRAVAPLLVLVRAEPASGRARSPRRPRSGTTCAASATPHGVTDSIRFGAEVLTSHWDDGRPACGTSRPPAGSLTARVLIGAMGGLADPAVPQIKGLDSFDRQGLPLRAVGPRPRPEGRPRRRHRHRRLARSSSSRRSRRTSAQLDLYQRTPPWIVPKPNRRLGARPARALQALPRPADGSSAAPSTGDRRHWSPGFVINPRLQAAGPEARRAPPRPPGQGR